MIEQPTTSTGLAVMTRGASEDKGGHLILADWLEEHLDRADIAAVLRASVDNPGIDAQDTERTEFHDFRYEFLDADVFLHMTHWHVWQYYQAGMKPEQQEGYVLGMCVKAGVPGGPLAWMRWLPTKGEPGEAVKALWERLGAAVPKLEEE